MKTRPNLVNFFYLVGSGLIVQLSGSIYRIWLARKIGPEGLGILQMIYPVYRLLSGIATIGLPLALTKWVAEYFALRDYSKIDLLKKWATRIILVLSIIIASLLFLITPFLSQYVFTDPRVRDSLLIVVFAIPFSAISAVYRGYFHGFSLMAPTAISEITEQAVEVSTTIIFVELFAWILPFSLFATPVLGLTMGEITCLITLLIFSKNYRPSISPKLSPAALPYTQIIRFSWPVLLNQIVVSVSLASEGVIIPHLLMNDGFKAAVSTGLFGKLVGMAEPIAYFPLIFLAPLGSVLSPQISSAFRTRSMGKLSPKVSLFYIASSLICLLCFFVILFMAAPISCFLYNDLSPTLLIKLLVIGLPFTGIAILNLTILGAVGATDKILFLTIWAVGLKTFSLVILIPLFRIEGAAWAINITQIFTCLASLAEVKRFLPKPAA